MKRCSHPTNSESRSTNRQAEYGADCIIRFGVRSYRMIKECNKSFGEPDTYDLARGLTLDGHSPRRLRRRGRSPAEGSSPSWTLRLPQLGRPFSSFLPPLEGERHLLLPPPHLRRRRAHWSRRANPTTPGAGNSFESPWPSPWPSSPAPREVPEPVASVSVHLLGLRAKGPDSQTVWMSSSNPVKGTGV